MPRLPSLFRPKPKTTHQPRRTWPRLRRSKGTAASTDRDNKPSVTDPDAELQHLVPDRGTGAAGSGEEETTVNDDEIQPAPTAAQQEQQPLIDPEPSRNSIGSSEMSRSQHGSKRLKKFVARFRGSKSHEVSLLSLSEALQSEAEESNIPMSLPKTEPTEKDQPGPGDEAHKPEPKQKDPVRNDNETTPTPGPSTVTRQGNEPSRNVSAQTVCSQESKLTGKTVSRHPSQRLPMPIQDPREEDLYFQGLLNYSMESTHQPEVSDPFSDGKDVEASSMTRPKSKGSDQSTLTQIKVSSAASRVQSSQASASGSRAEGSQANVSRHASSRTTAGAQKTPVERVTSNSSRASRSSILSRIDPARAAAAFNRLARERGVQLSIPDSDVNASSVNVSQPSPEVNPPRPRHRLLRRVRPTQSNMTLAVDSQPSAPKLRRTKTFANFTRRPSPMTSLRGKSIETLARLGGHSFLVLPVDLAPSPLQLPACIVAMVMYLRKNATNVCDLFEEPGDIKAATTLYDYFANHVLSEKDDPKIALTMRVIAMPTWEKETEAGTVLSVAWTLKALLEGLPGGVLGSTRLWETLKAIYFTETAVVDRVKFIALAMIALVSETQCALICAVFGLLSGLVRQGSTLSGTTLQPVASPMDADRLARVFGPLMLERQTEGESSEEIQVEQEVSDQRVAALLLEHWRSVSRQLRDWSFAAIQ